MLPPAESHCQRDNGVGKVNTIVLMKASGNPATFTSRSIFPLTEPSSRNNGVWRSTSGAGGHGDFVCFRTLHIVAVLEADRLRFHLPFKRRL